MNYLYQDPNDSTNIRGPVSVSKLKRLKAEGKLHDSSQICAAGTEDWKCLGDVLVGGPRVCPVPPVISPQPPATPARASATSPTDKPKTSVTKGCLGCLGLFVGIAVVLGILGALVGPSDLTKTDWSSASNSPSSRGTAEVSLQTIKRTAEEAFKWAMWEAKGQYYSFDVLITNVVESANDVRYSGQKRAGEDAMDRHMFGAAYDAWSQGDVFIRRETNYTCNLVITHTKPKPDHERSEFFSKEEKVIERFVKRPPVDMLAREIVGMLRQQYSHFELVGTNFYKVNRIVGGQLMKPVPGSVGPLYVWDTMERERFYVTPTWVVVVEARRLKRKVGRP